MYNAVDIAVYIVDYCIREDCPVSNLKLQYMLMILKDLYKEKTGKELFYEDIIHGSYFDYIPSVYYRFCHFGAMPITFNHQIIVLPHDVTEFLKDNIIKLSKQYPFELKENA